MEEFLEAFFDGNYWITATDTSRTPEFTLTILAITRPRKKKLHPLARALNWTILTETAMGNSPERRTFDFRSAMCFVGLSSHLFSHRRHQRGCIFGYIHKWKTIWFIIIAIYCKKINCCFYRFVLIVIKIAKKHIIMVHNCSLSWLCSLTRAYLISKHMKFAQSYSLLTRYVIQ